MSALNVAAASVGYTGGQQQYHCIACEKANVLTPSTLHSFANIGIFPSNDILNKIS